MTFLPLLLGVLVSVAFAQEPPVIICGNLPGCGGDGASVDVLTESALPSLALFMIRIAAGLAVLFIVIAGYQMFFALGDEGKYQAGKQAIVLTLSGLGLAVLSQTIVALIVTEPAAANITDETTAIAAVVSFLLTIVDGVFFVMIGYAGIKMILAQGRTEEYTKARSIFIQCIIGAVTINLAYTLVQVVASYFGV